MICNKKLLAIIPARGGSKRLPRKNILNLSGKPMIAWTIEAALGSKYIDRVVVSTDDDEIALISTKYGADVPFKRPDFLSTDQSSSIDTVLHTINTLENQGDSYEYIILLQPTSPLRNFQHINNSIEQLIRKNDEAVISVCEMEHRPTWCGELDESLDMINFVNNLAQDDVKMYRLNGAIYLNKISSLKKEKNFLLKLKCSAFVMSQAHSIDIDHDIDLDLARVVINRY